MGGKLLAGVLLLCLQGGLLVYQELQTVQAARTLPGEVSRDASRVAVASVPAGAAVLAADGKPLGLTPSVLDGVGEQRSFRLEKAGYIPAEVDRERLIHPVLLQPTWPLWLVLHAPGLAGLGLVLAHFRGRSSERVEELRTGTTRTISERYIGPGAQLGPYVLGERLGQGAMSEVFAADNAAVKVLTEDVCKNPQARERFLREAQICQGMRHPGIVAVLGVGEHAATGRLWMAQEFIDGKSLDRTPMPMPWRKAVELLIGIAEGLEYAHQAGVVHRDLKPGNILLRADGRPVISDFGLAHGKHYETITKTDVTLGTPAYMPPEQLTERRVDGRADLYSLGCIAYELLSGRVPFENDDVVKLLMAHHSQPAPPLVVPDVPPELAALVASLLEKDPAVRPASAAALAEALKRL